MQSQTYELSDDAYISLLTEGAGEELYSGYGHTGIRIKDDAQKLDIVFHYGLFDFNAPGFYTNFLKGKLNYKMGGQYYSSFYNNAKSEKRDITEQILNLNQKKKNNLYKQLHENYLPENRAYWYDFFYDNCSTRPRDYFEKIFQDSLQYKKKVPSLSFRQLLEQHQQFYPWTDFGIDLLHGANTDKIVPVRDEMFLPLQLMYHLRDAVVDNEPAISSENIILDFPEKKLPNFWKLPIFAFFILLLFEIYLFLLWKKTAYLKLIRIYDRLWFIGISLASLLILIMWFGTEHYATKNNWNILWLNPLFIWMGVVQLSKISDRTKLISKIILACLILSLLGWYIIPQSFHPAVFSILIIVIIKISRYIGLKLGKGQFGSFKNAISTKS